MLLVCMLAISKLILSLLCFQVDNKMYRFPL